MKVATYALFMWTLMLVKERSARTHFIHSDSFKIDKPLLEDERETTDELAVFQTKNSLSTNVEDFPEGDVEYGDPSAATTAAIYEPTKRQSLSSIQQNRLRRIIYEVKHCMRPCLNNGLTLLPGNTVDMCRCICPPRHYGVACEFEMMEEHKRKFSFI